MSLQFMDINAVISDFRVSLPTGCATAAAIDRRDSRLYILMSARREGYHDFAQRLEAVMSGRRVPAPQLEETVAA